MRKQNVVKVDAGERIRGRTETKLVRGSERFHSRLRGKTTPLMKDRCERCGKKLTLARAKVEGLDYCAECGAVMNMYAQGNAISRKDLLADERLFQKVFFSSIPELPGITIESYVGFVCGRALLSLDALDDILEQGSDESSEYVGSVSRYFFRAEQSAMRDLAIEVRRVNADYVLGVRMEHKVLQTRQGSRLLVTVWGTAAISSKKRRVEQNTGEDYIVHEGCGVRYE